MAFNFFQIYIKCGADRIGTFKYIKMGRKKIKNTLSVEKHSVSDKSTTKDSQTPKLPEKGVIFEDHLLENVQPENITYADIKRITSKTFDFLRATGLRQTHISAITGINQSILSIILRDPGTKTISINRKKDVVVRLCEYYNKINLGLVSRDPLTAPKICNSRKAGEVNQKKRTVSRRNTSEDEETSSTLANSENLDGIRSSQHNNLEQEKIVSSENQVCHIGQEGTSFSLNELGIKSTSIDNAPKLTKRNIFLFTSCTKCPRDNAKVRKVSKTFLDSSCSVPVSSFINGNALIECTELNSLRQLNGTKIDKSDDFVSRILEPTLIPLSVNLRHFITGSFTDYNTSNENTAPYGTKLNPSAILSTLKGKNFKSERFVWSSVSDSNTLWGFIESLSRERHLSTFMNNDQKKGVFKWLIREIENYKNLYLQFLYLIMDSDISPGNNSRLICEIRLNESYGDVVINDKFKWNISNPTRLLLEQIECLVSDLRLPQELFSELLYSALKQVFDEIADIVKEFSHENKSCAANVKASLTNIGSQYEGDVSSNCSFGANRETRTSVDKDSSMLPFYGNFVEWGSRADLEYDSDDNAKLYPIIENAEEKRQIENRNRFRKRR